MPYKVLLRDESEAVNSVFILFHLKSQSCGLLSRKFL